MTLVAASFAVLGAAILFVAGVGVLALGARGWSYAIADAHRAESHGVELGERKTTYAQAHDAMDELDQRRAPRAEHGVPSDDELRAAIIAERNRQVEEFDTLSNEGIEPQEPIPSGTFYNIAQGLDQ